MSSYQIWHDGKMLGTIEAEGETDALRKCLENKPYLEGLEVYPASTVPYDVEAVFAAAHEEMVGLGNDGFCKKCGHQQGGCEPDARDYECESCGENAVDGAAEILLNLI